MGNTHTHGRASNQPYDKNVDGISTKRTVPHHIDNLKLWGDTIKGTYLITASCTPPASISVSWGGRGSDNLVSRRKNFANLHRI